MSKSNIFSTAALMFSTWNLIFTSIFLYLQYQFWGAMNKNDFDLARKFLEYEELVIWRIIPAGVVVIILILAFIWINEVRKSRQVAQQ